LRRNILLVLRDIGDIKAVDPLINLLAETGDNGLKRSISVALRDIGDPKAVDPLINLLEKTDDYRTRIVMKGVIDSLRRK